MKQQDYTIIKVITTILVVIAHITRFYSMGGGAIKMGDCFKFCVNTKN